MREVTILVILFEKILFAIVNMVGRVVSKTRCRD